MADARCSGCPATVDAIEAAFLIRKALPLLCLVCRRSGGPDPDHERDLIHEEPWEAREAEVEVEP